MEKDWSTVEILRHSRHDWLNKIQLIKGNLELSKPDRVKAIIDDIILVARHEAKISSIDMPKFSELLLTANWRFRVFQSEFEVIDMVQGTSVMDQMMYDWTMNFFHFLEEQLDAYSENRLLISIYKNESTDLIRFSFDLQGKIKDVALVTEFLRNSSKDNQTIDFEETTEQMFYFTMDINRKQKTS
ncbi:Spo0B C-terminal domain-containing protein [Bacillus cihuensis]|uniref:Spo0B C-terminal domain-containing protein n=1 Tax=Bacillus cihuensis TaxID=1208599 RepID=UPI0004183801|nr:Spo0B C-terminal domain-containing protein [Bacillus cihuensis]